MKTISLINVILEILDQCDTTIDCVLIDAKLYIQYLGYSLYGNDVRN